MLREEGLENAWARHQRNHKALKAGLQTLGMSFLVEEPHRLPQMNAVTVLPGVDEKEVRRRLLLDYNLEIGAGPGRPRRQDLALRNHGLLLQDGERHALAMRSGNGVRGSRA